MTTPKKLTYRQSASNTGRWFDITSTNTAFHFVPDELTDKCRSLIKSYHAAHGYSSLPDALWRSDSRGIIKRHVQLGHIFKKASQTKNARQTNDAFLFVASFIMAIEVLVRDFAAWGTQFPDAKQEAEKLLGLAPLRPRIWLMDRYIRQPESIRPGSGTKPPD